MNRFFSFAIVLLFLFINLLSGCAGRGGDIALSFGQVIIIGQNGWLANKANRGKSTAAANSLNEPWDVAVDITNSTIYIADTKNNRVLRYNTLTPADNAKANLELGQVNFVANEANRGGDADADTLSAPKGVHVIGGATPRLAVADTDNNRVLIWTALPTANEQDANLVLGQDDDDLDGNFFNDNLPNQGGDPKQNSLKEPTGVFIDSTNTRIIVADTGNNRLLIWNTLTPANGADANIVVGQTVQPGGSDDPFEYALINEDNDDEDGDTIPDPDSNSLYFPTSIYLVNTPNFFINDQKNNRVLVYNVWPLVANADGSTSSVAIACMGQTAFDKRIANQRPGGVSGNPSTSNLDNPFDVFSDGTRTWITDTGNNRIIRYDSIPTACNAPAGTIIGQPFTTGSSPGVGPNRFNTPRGIFQVVSGATRLLWIADSLNHRVIRIADN